MVFPDSSKPFRCYTEASCFAIVETLSQEDENARDPAIAYFSKWLSPAKKNYNINGRELLGFVYFINRCHCYLEGSEFEAMTDNQVLKNFFSKINVSRREAWWIKHFTHFGVKMTVQKGKAHVLGHNLSPAHYVLLDQGRGYTLQYNNIELLMIKFPEKF